MARRSDAGYSLLEQALALPVLLLFIFGVVDANNVIQGYNAIRQGVTAAVRCLYPTDGECVSVDEDTRTRLYSVTALTRAPEAYGSEVDYRGEASWLTAPKNTYDEATVSVLGSAVYRAPRRQFDATQELLVNPEGLVPYKVMTYSVPYLSGSLSQVNFGTQNRDGRRSDYPASAMRSVSLAGVGGSTTRISADADGGDRIGATAWITLPNPYSVTINNETFEDVPCFKSVNLDGALEDPSAARFSESCKGTHANILIWATGNTGSNESGAKGKVVFSLEFEDGSEPRPLGGRLLTMEKYASDDFLPRGFTGHKVKGEPDCADGKTQLDGDKTDSYYRVNHDLVDPCHAKLHSDILVPWDKRFRFVFRLQSETGGRVEWHGEELKLALPAFVDKADRVVCAGEFPLSADLRRIGCDANHPAGPAKAIDEKSGTRVSRTGTLPCEADSESAARAYINASFAYPDSYTVAPKSAPACGDETRTQVCPANFGHPGMPPEDGAWVLNRAIGESLCPVRDSDLNARGLQPSNPAWTVSRKKISIEKFTWEAPDCRHLVPPREVIPASLLRYPHFNLEAPAKTEAAVRYTLPISSESPKELIKRDQYDCPGFAVDSKIYDRAPGSETRSWIPENSLFVGFQRDLGCAFSEILRQAAEDSRFKDHRLDPLCYFEARITAKNEIPLPAGAERKDACTYVRFDDSKIVAQENLGTFPEKEIPNVCKANPANCRVSFVGYRGGDAPAVKHDGTLAIERFGIPAVRNFFPRARFVKENCSGDFCASIEELDKDNPERTHVAMVGKINVPTYLLKAIGRDHFEVTYRAQERYEQELAK